MKPPDWLNQSATFSNEDLIACRYQTWGTSNRPDDVAGDPGSEEREGEIAMKSIKSKLIRNSMSYYTAFLPCFWLAEDRGHVSDAVSSFPGLVEAPPPSGLNT